MIEALRSRRKAVIVIISHSSDFTLHPLERLHRLVGKGLITSTILTTLGGLSTRAKAAKYLMLEPDNTCSRGFSNASKGALSGGQYGISDSKQ